MNEQLGCMEAGVMLKPCPFCGETPNVFRVKDDRYVKGERNWVVECKTMGCFVGRHGPNRSLDNLIEGWNTRKYKG